MPPPHSLQRAILLASLALLAILSIAILSLKATTLRFIADHSADSFGLSPDGPHTAGILSVLPRHLSIAPTKLTIAAAAISTILSLAALAFVLFAWPDGRRTYPLPPTRILPPLLTLPSLLLLAALLLLTITHARSPHITFTPANADGGYDWDERRGTFDLETWACELAAYAGTGAMRGTYAAQCGVEGAARGVLVLAWVVAVGVGAVGWWACRGMRGRVREGVEKRRERREFYGAGWEETGG